MEISSLVHYIYAGRERELRFLLALIDHYSSASVGSVLGPGNLDFGYLIS